MRGRRARGEGGGGVSGPWRQSYIHQYLFTSLGTTHTSQTCIAFACDHGTAASPTHCAAASMDELDLSGTHAVGCPRRMALALPSAAVIL